jgi:hypothetical protein
VTPATSAGWRSSPICRVEASVAAPLAALERAHAGEATRFALFTGHLSAANPGLYRRLGYEEVDRRPLSDRVVEVHLAKPVSMIGETGRPDVGGGR